MAAIKRSGSGTLCPFLASMWPKRAARDHVVSVTGTCSSAASCSSRTSHRSSVLTPMSSSARIGQQIETKSAMSSSLSRSLRVSWPFRSARIQTLVSTRRGPRSTAGMCTTTARTKFSLSGFEHTSTQGVSQRLTALQPHQLLKGFGDRGSLASGASQSSRLGQQSMVECYGESLQRVCHSTTIS